MIATELALLDDLDLSEKLQQSCLFDADWYLSRYPAANFYGMGPLDNYIKVGRFLDRNPSPQFDAEFYRASYGDLPELFPAIDFHFLTDDDRPTNLADAEAIVDADAKSAGFDQLAFTKIISFCIPVMNRLGDLHETLRVNLDQNRHLQEQVEFVVISFDADDSVKNWIESEFKDELLTGYLRFYRSDILDVWHFPRAKNAFKGKLKGHIHSSLDGDNFVSSEEAQILIDLFNRFGESFVFHSFSGSHGDGTCGRVTTSTRAFYAVGYDDTLLTQQYNDIDLISSTLSKYPWLKFFHTSGSRDIFSERMNNTLSQAAGFKNKKHFVPISDRKFPLNPRGAGGIMRFDHRRARNHINSLYTWTKCVPAELFDSYSSEKLSVNYDCLVQTLPCENLFAESFDQRNNPIEGQLPKSDLTAIICARNQTKLLSRNIEYHRELGVDNFLIIDDHSTTPLGENDFGKNAYVFVPRSGSFKTAKQLWMETLARRFVPEGGWVLLLDVDEFLELPPDHGDIKSFLSTLPRSRDFVGACLIDVFASSNASRSDSSVVGSHGSDILFQFRTDPVPENYSNNNTVRWGFGVKAAVSWAFDVRYSVFYTFDCLRKIPLFRLGPDTHFHSGQHTLRNRRSEGRFTDDWLDRFSLVIRHEKLLLNLADATEDANLDLSVLRHREAQNRIRIREAGKSISTIEHALPYSRERVYACFREVIERAKK